MQYRVPCATLQVATATQVYVFQLTALRRHDMGMPPAVQVEHSLAWLPPILDSSHVIKCGVGVKDDIMMLTKWGVAALASERCAIAKRSFVLLGLTELNTASAFCGSLVAFYGTVIDTTMLSCIRISTMYNEMTSKMA
jgi:hypothetical protein